jgi:AraC-like DNA-binding protein
MHTSLSAEWWPEQQLRHHEVNQVFVCGHHLDPPLYSHVVNFPRLEIPLAGCYENWIEKDGKMVTVRLRPGTALFAAPNCWNLPTWRLNVDLMSLIFGKKHLGISLVKARGPDVQKLVAGKFSTAWPLNGPLPPMLEALVELQAAGGPPEAFVAQSRALISCVRELIRQPSAPTGSRAQSLLELLYVYLQSHYQHEITRESVARQFEVSPNHLSRLFHTHGHMTFSSYLTHVRIDRAKHLLRNYNLKLDDLAARCGYSNAPYFCLVFKRATKLTPAEYRARARLTQTPPTVDPAGKSDPNAKTRE